MYVEKRCDYCFGGFWIHVLVMYYWIEKDHTVFFITDTHMQSYVKYGTNYVKYKPVWSKQWCLHLTGVQSINLNIMDVCTYKSDKSYINYMRMSICDYNRCLLSIIPGDRCHIIFIYQLWFLFYGSFTIALYRPTFQYKIFLHLLPHYFLL